MNFSGFNSRDFEVFQIPGLAPRMEMLIACSLTDYRYLQKVRNNKGNVTTDLVDDTPFWC